MSYTNNFLYNGQRGMRVDYIHNSQGTRPGDEFFHNGISKAETEKRIDSKLPNF